VPTPDVTAPVPTLPNFRRCELYACPIVSVYPFFPAPPGRTTKMDALIKGRKCPLLAQHLRHHAAMIRAAWNAVIERNPAIRSWLNKVRLVGYTEPPATEPRRGQPRRRAA
jgi:hypothetical protein